MTATLPRPATVDVEGSARILRGLAVPFGVPTVVADRLPDGAILLSRESWDAESFVGLDASVPLLTGHDTTRPLGRIDRMWIGPTGLEIEGTLVGSASELDGTRERVGAGVLAALSIGFINNDRLDRWTKPTSRSGLPSVLRRGARVREISLVLWPAFDGAKVTGIRNRSERQAWSDQVLGEFRQRKAREQAAHDEAQARIRDRMRVQLLTLRAECQIVDRRLAAQRERQATAPPRPAPTPATLDADPDPLELPPLPADPGDHATEAQRFQHNIDLERWCIRARAVHLGQPDPGPVPRTGIRHLGM